MSPEYSIFISHGQEDVEAAKRIYHALQQAGLSPWLAEYSLIPGQRWEPTIKQAIRESRFFVVVLSTSSVNRTGFVNKEISEALGILDQYPEQSIFIIPLRIDNCRPSHEKLAALHYVDMFPSWDDGMQSLFKALQISTVDKGLTDRPSDLFTIGYVHNRCLWFLVTEITFCMPGSNLEDHVRKLQRPGITWFPDRSIEKIATYAQRLHWNWEKYVNRLRSLLAFDAFRTELSAIENATSAGDQRVAALEALRDRVMQFEGELIRQVGKTDPDIPEAEMVFVGSQMGKIDHMITVGEKTYSIQKVMPSCREFLSVMFDQVTLVDIHKFIVDFPGIESRAGNIGHQELRALVSRIKESLLKEPDLTAGTWMGDRLA